MEEIEDSETKNHLDRENRHAGTKEERTRSQAPIRIAQRNLSLPCYII